MPAVRVAINGYGRIGRNILRAHYEKKLHPEIQIVAINDLGDIATNVHLTRYDTTHGKFPGDVSVAKEGMQVNGNIIRRLIKRSEGEETPQEQANKQEICQIFC